MLFYKNCVPEKVETKSLLNTAEALNLPYHTASVSLYLLHRFIQLKKSITGDELNDLGHFTIIVGSLSLAMKIEETVKKLPEIINNCRSVTNQPPINDAKDYKIIKDKAMAVERILLEDLEFNVQIEIPHRFAMSLCHTFQGNYY